MVKIMNKYYFFMFGSVVIASVSQVLLKISAHKSYPSFIREYFNPLVIIGYGLMIISTLTTIAAYQGMEYKNGPIIESLGYILVMVMCFFILEEKVSRKMIIGYTLIFTGVIVFYISF